MRQSPVRLNLRHFTHLIVLSTLFILVLFAYQNCSSPLSETDELASVAANSQFAFDATIDRIAHMSCGNMPGGYDSQAFFSFRVGSYNSGSGVKLSSSFQNQTGGYSPDKRVDVLQTSSSDGSQFQLAIRSKSNLQQVFSFSAPSEGFAYGNYPYVLTESPVVNTLAQSYSGTRFNSFSGLNLGADINFVSSNQGIYARDTLNAKTGLLAVTFSTDGSYGAVAPTGAGASKAYGYGYEVTFSKPSHLSDDKGANALMTSVKEFNLTSGQATSGSWYCDPNLRFVIVRDGDQGSKYPCSATPASSEPASTPVLTELRKILPASDWAVDLTNKCIVAKKAGLCYGSNSPALTIRYPAATATCDPALNTCPHYLTICKKM